MSAECTVRSSDNDFFRNIYFFHAMPEESLNKIAALCTEQAYSEGDIRNPLSALKSRVQLLLTNRDDRSYLETAVAGINHDISRMETLAAEFLDYARGEIRLDMGIVTVEELFARLTEALAPRIDTAGVLLHTESEVTRPVIMDEHRMLRVLVTAAENACAAMPAGGELYVTAKESNGSLVLVVRDTGTGMTQDVIDNIFKPFYTASAGGTGLGMLIIKSIVEAHNGAITVDSVPDEGTTITISLPLRH